MRNKAAGSIEHLGRCAIMAWKVFVIIVKRPPRFSFILKQMYVIGVASLPVVFVTGAFTGMVMAVQSYYQFQKISMETAIGIVVGLSMTNELGPVLTALMVSGRVGAAMAAEIATMKVTEQIDALHSLAVDPLRYLVATRLIAGICLIPLLTVCAMFIGITGGFIVSVYLKHINKTFYLANMLDFTNPEDVACGLIKSVVFAFIIIIVSCYNGFHASGGAEGVGQATTKAVVISCIAILVSDFFLSILLV